MDSTAALIATPIVLYVVGSILFPYGRCRSCRGATTSHGSNARRWNVCRRCGGTGQRVRLGARLLGRRE